MANIFNIFDKTCNKVIGDIDLSPAMVYLIDIVNANAFPFLASQFDVEGFKGWDLAAIGWDLATIEKQKRELIKTSIQIKKHLGTPYAIKQALKAIGFDKVTIQEGGTNWANFNVTIKTKFSVVISDETKALIRNLILYYKNARSNLVDIVYQQDGVYYHDATLYHNSTINYQ